MEAKSPVSGAHLYCWVQPPSLCLPTSGSTIPTGYYAHTVPGALTASAPESDSPASTARSHHPAPLPCELRQAISLSSPGHHAWNMGM